jgi:hypothetical protein
MRRAKGNMMIRNSLNQLAMALIPLAGLLLFQRVALADVTLQLVGTNQGFNMGGVYTSPYTINVSDGASTVSTLALACDDFTTEIYYNKPWTATLYTLADVTATGPQKFINATNDVTYPTGTGTGTGNIHDGATINYTIKRQYDAAAWLAEQLLTVPSILTNSETAGYYSYAIWQIFDPKAWQGYGGNNLTAPQQDQVTYYMWEAFQQNSLGHVIYIYTPNPADASQEFIGIGASLNRRQQFETATVPEGSTVAFLAFDFLALPGIILLLRRRILRSA